MVDRLEIGVDVVGIARIQQAVERFGDRFLRRIFTPDELAYALSTGNKWEHLAGRFAAKEAASKALGTGMVGVGWTDFEVRRLPSGKPELHLSGRAAQKADDLGLAHWAVSLAHDGHTQVAVATVVASGLGGRGDEARGRTGEGDLGISYGRDDPAPPPAAQSPVAPSPPRLIAPAPRTAWLFPGQGSQRVGMARDLYDADPAVRSLFEEASDRTGLAIARLCFEGPPEELQRTEHAQPCLLTACTACARALAAAGFTADFVAGHSLGEYSALVQAGVLAFGDAVYAVHRRGELMAHSEQGAMAAILGLSDDQVAEACDRAGGVVVPANFNAPGQVVISGATEAVAVASEIARTLGATRIVPLKVSGPFHSPLMRPVAAELTDVLRNLPFTDAAVPLISNVEAKPVQGAHLFPTLLVRQVAEPVRWTDVMRSLLNAGVTRCIEVGPGRVLSGLVRQTDRSVETAAAGSVEAIRRLAGARR